MSIKFCCFFLRAVFVSLTLSFFGASSSAYAGVTVNVDGLVQVDYSRLSYKRDKSSRNSQVFTTQATITNISSADLMPPIRLAITTASKKNITLDNADGITSDGLPYVLMSLNGNTLAPGETTVAHTLEFTRIKHLRDIRAKKSRGSKGSGKSDDSKGSKGSKGSRSSKGSKGSSKGKEDRISVAPTPIANRIPYLKNCGRDKGSKGSKGGKYRYGLCFNDAVFSSSSVAPGVPASSPNALGIDTGSVDVMMNVVLLGDAQSYAGDVVLRDVHNNIDVIMADDGFNGDVLAGDGIYSTVVSVDTDVPAPACLSYTGVITVDGAELQSAVYDLCITALPIGGAPTDTSPENVIALSDNSSVLANEIVVNFVDGVSESTINKIAKRYNAKVVGTILPLGLYQLRLNRAVSTGELNRIMRRLNNLPQVKVVEPNYVVEFSLVPSDPEFPNQHGAQLVRADDIWDIATGAGRTITIFDSGVLASHADLTGKLVGPPVTTDADSNGIPDAHEDAINHGTLMAGIAAANADNATAVAGVAHGALLESVLLPSGSANDGFNLRDGLVYLSGPGATGTIVNMSMNLLNNTSSGVNGLCNAIQLVINSGKLVVNSAGNQGSNVEKWPASCNDEASDVFTALNGGIVTDKNMFITVANSVSCNSGCTMDSGAVDSNYGPLADVAAPGTNIVSTSNDGLVATSSGTSAAAATVSGVAALMNECGVALSAIESTLQSTATGTVNFSGTNEPRIDVYAALGSLNTAPGALAISSTSIDELASGVAASPVAVGDLSVTSTDACDSISYSIVPGGDGASFQISSGTLEVKAGTLLDREEPRTAFNLTVRATDFFGASAADLPITVTLNGINDNDPVINPAGGPVIAHAENVQDIFAVSATDADLPAQVLSPVSVSTSLVGSNIDGALFEVVGGQLRFKTAPDFETPADSGLDNNYRVTLTVSDGAGGSDAVSYSIDVTNVIESVIVPNVVGSPQATAESTLTAAQLNASVSLATSATVAAGDVISQNPAAGTSANENSVVNIVVSSGSGLAADPILVNTGFVDYNDAFGNPFRRWTFDVTNKSVYPADFFAATPDYGPCGLNDTPARSWVNFYDAGDDSYIYGFCALGTPDNLNGIWFAKPAGTPPPAAGVYITIVDRSPGGLTYTSNVVPASDLAFP